MLIWPLTAECLTILPSFFTPDWALIARWLFETSTRPAYLTRALTGEAPVNVLYRFE